jgi:hypothetical protein
MRAPPRKLSLLVSIAAAALSLLAAPPVLADGVVKRAAPVRPQARLSADAYNRDVRIHNQTGWTMTQLQAASVGDWGGDLLGPGALSPGDSIVVTIDNGSGACRYALRAQFDNGQALQRTGVNVCQVADYYFTR